MSTTRVKLWNESALGIYSLCWKSRTGGRCEVSWFDSLDEPVFSFYSTTRGSMTPPMPVRNPGRFGPWPFRSGSHTRTFTDFKAFVQRFAEACESEDETS